MKKDKKKILVIGESCRDIFVYCDTTRLAPDIPVPVLQEHRRVHNPGMAMNLHRNVKAIYPHCEIVTNDNWKNVTKTRFMDDRTNHGFFRVDVDHRLVGKANVRKIPLKNYDIIAISDYNKGYLSEDDIRHICENHPCVFIDTKKRVSGFLGKARFIKINEYEYNRSLPIGERLESKIIRTRGQHGALYRGKTYPVKEIEVKDSSGAGDSFFAALVVRYAETGDIDESIRFANDCASEVVKVRGVTVIRRPEESVRA